MEMPQRLGLQNRGLQVRVCLNPSFDGNASTAQVIALKSHHRVLILLLMEMPQRQNMENFNMLEDE